MVTFNCVKQRRRNPSGKNSRKNKSMGTLLPVDVGLKIHADTRKIMQIKSLSDINVSIAPQR